MKYKTTLTDHGVRYLSRIIVFILISLMLAGCAVETAQVYVKNGKAYGKISETFRNRWWNYYERGFSFAEGEFYDQAESDFREAIRLRKQDQRMARTYGMHFVDYFPHRELGILYYHIKELENAKNELEISLKQFPSAKAQFYLDKVRKSIIEQEGRRASAPSLTLDFEKEVVWTKADTVIISGEAEDENYISHITVREIPQSSRTSETSEVFNALFSEGSQKRIRFRKPLPLPQGRHEIEVSARNLSDKQTKQRLILYVDREGPVITIKDIQTDKEQRVIVDGSVYDAAGISEIRINDRVLEIQEDTEIFFSEKFREPVNELEVTALDRLGNITEARLPSELLIPSPLASSPDILLTSVTSDKGWGGLASLFGPPKDEEPPVITLKGWSDTQTVFLEKIYLEGKISDKNNITNISVNGTPILRHEGKYLFFSLMVDLTEGENHVTLKAEDAFGNSAAKKIAVFRKIPAALQLTERLSISVLPFDQKGHVSDVSVSFQDNLIHSLVERNRFQVIERDRLDAVLQEQKLSRTELLDRKTALNLGRLIAARSVMTGSIIETKDGVEIVARLIDTETSEILAAEDVYDEARDISALRRLSEGMAVKFHREFPLVDGLVVRQKGKHIFTDLGQNLIKLGRGFIVYREETVKHPVTGKILGADNTILCRARVTQVMPDLSKAEILSGEPGEIRPLDKVIPE